MRSLTMRLLLVLFFVALGSLVLVEGQESARQSEGSAGCATKEEVDELRKEVAAQRQTTQELKAIVERMAEARAQTSHAGLGGASGGRAVVPKTTQSTR